MKLTTSLVAGIVLLWFLLLPAWKFPDEPTAFATIQDYAELKKIPTDQNISQELAMALAATNNTAPSRYGYDETSIGALDASTRTFFVDHRPLPHNLFTAIWGAFAYHQAYYSNIYVRLYAVRAAFILLYLGFVTVCYLIAAKLFIHTSNVPRFIVLTIGLNPYLIFHFSNTGGMVNVSALSLVVATFAVAWLFRYHLNRHSAIIAVFAILIVANITCLTLIVNRYYPITNYAEFSNQISQYKPVCLKWPNLILWLVGDISLVVFTTYRLVTKKLHHRFDV